MEEAKKPEHGQIRIDENGNLLVGIEENTQGKHIKSDTITPDNIRDKELDNLRSKLKKANILAWALFFYGVSAGCHHYLAFEKLG